MRTTLVLLASLSLAACGASTGGTSSGLGGSSTYLSSNLVTNPATLDGVTLTFDSGSRTIGSGVTIQYNGSQSGVGSFIGASGSTNNSTVAFTNHGSQSITTLNGFTYISYWDQKLNGYKRTQVRNATSHIYVTNLSRMYRDPNNPDNYIVKTFYGIPADIPDVDPTIDPQQIGYGADVMHSTPAAQFPVTGTATYNGIVEVTDQFTSTATGTIALSADLAGKTISGSIDIGAGTVFGATTFKVAPGKITSDTTGTTFHSDVTKADGTPFDSLLGHGQDAIGIDGAFSGSHGQNVLGTFNADDSGASGNALAGIFTARQP